MEGDGYSFLEGVSSPSKKSITDLENVQRGERPTAFGNFTIWRNPGSRFSTLVRNHMHQGAASLLFYEGKFINKHHYIEPRIVRYDGENTQPQTFVIGTPSDKRTQLVILFRPLKEVLCSGNGFFEICSGSFAWNEHQVYDWLQPGTNQSGSKWEPISVSHDRVLVVRAGTLVRFGPGKGPCDFVCMGYSNSQASLTPSDIEFELLVAPFLRRIPEHKRLQILSRPALQVQDQGYQGLRTMENNGDPHLSNPNTELNPPFRKDWNTITQVLKTLRNEEQQMIRFFNGDRFEDIFASSSPDNVYSQTPKSEKLRYLLDVQTKTWQYFKDYPDFDTRKDNIKFWENIYREGFRGGMQSAFASKYRYDEKSTRAILNRGGKIQALTSELKEPGLAPFLLPVVDRLSEISYPSMKRLSDEIMKEFPGILQASSLIRGKWEMYVKTYLMFMTDIEADVSSNPCSCEVE
ncbi:hypothetical protein BO94DRAFT_507484 [Aspergillus sclerotioniger CBS 115572]|uniref:Uncharacterized protein n=1 Tax=Aspergillus sclerotioniger CBS 115572 TaxID=1450535 RepID=A0A317XE35_9EURO|nr:hypothetical protein BO94DRAFT_507484 [Aspergillus sclerotioniger CBS 115572]PWY96012.1 hypothetical protein BO94DRAFT_507484 [Aspergillus sclerotioniger CBS 115572]